LHRDRQRTARGIPDGRRDEPAQPQGGRLLHQLPAGLHPAWCTRRPAALIPGSVFLTEGILWLGLIALLGDRLNAVLSRAGIRRRLERLTGLVMIGFGVRLAPERQ
jgi:threonine/homoserine/homoserine lactone efflux protein